MKKFLLFSFVFIFPSILFAQFVGNGFYRVKNRDTHRYLTIVDNRADVNIATTEPDLAAILPIKDFNKIVGNPASIIYIENVNGNDYILTAQNVNTYDLVGEYLKLRKMSDGSYYAYAAAKGMTKYLCDEQSSYDEGWLMTGTTMRNWNIIPVNSDSDNYFAAIPEFEHDGIFYTTLYASFPYKTKDECVEFFYVNKIVGNCAIIKKIDTNTVVSPLTPVVVRCKSSNYEDNKIDVVAVEGTQLDYNHLAGVLFDNSNKKHFNRLAYNPSTMRVLGKMEDGSIGFVTADINYLPANKAYLKVSEGTPAELRILTEEEYMTRIDDVPSVLSDKDAYYDLSGRRVSKMSKGIYISKDGNKICK